MSEILLEILKKLPLDALIYLCFTVVIIAGLVLIPFWVKRVELRMADIHTVNNKLATDKLRIDQVERRLRRLTDEQEKLDDRFNEFDVKLVRIETNLDSVIGGQMRILEKLNLL